MEFTVLTSNIWNADIDMRVTKELAQNTTLSVTGERGVLIVKQNSIGGNKLFIPGEKGLGTNISLLPNAKTRLCFINEDGNLSWEITPLEVNESAPIVVAPPTPTNLNFEGVIIPAFVPNDGFGNVLKVETLNVAECTRINQNGNIKAFKFNLRVLPINGITEFFINVLRNNSGNFSLVTKVSIPTASLVVGENTYTLPTSVATLLGDYISIGYTSATVQPKLISMCADTVGGKYVTAPPTYATSFQWLTKSTTLNYAPVIVIKE